MMKNKNYILASIIVISFILSGCAGVQLAGTVLDVAGKISSHSSPSNNATIYSNGKMFDFPSCVNESAIYSRLGQPHYAFANDAKDRKIVGYQGGKIIYLYAIENGVLQKSSMVTAGWLKSNKDNSSFVDNLFPATTSTAKANGTNNCPIISASSKTH